MAHAQSNSKNNKSNVNTIGGDNEEKPTTFHDFLGNKGQDNKESAPAAASGGRPPPEVSPSATSDLGSERQVSNHLEGIPFYGSRGDITGPESSTRFFTGYKRSNSDSFMASSKDKFPQAQVDSQDSPLLTKLLRYSGGELPRQTIDEEISFGKHQMSRPISNTLKWDNRAMPINLGPGLQFPPRAPPNRFKDTSFGPSIISQTAADEGSRTGIKGSGGLLSSLNATGGVISGRKPSGVLIRTDKQKSSVPVSEPESSTTPSQRGTESSGRQMTIFYGGQAHVFDNVHPNKADIIMALAGTNGGSWSTNYTTPNSAAPRPSSGENNAVAIAILRELHGRPSSKGDLHRGFEPDSYKGAIGTTEKTVSVQVEDEC
ncbi:hypothetical protein ACJIZ3_004963 [Penstemon smallii]|uniref:Protein TIFY n=1 Tax=Penstemon smallii TaxID=265156 RepID=A0ABD3S3V3_9LAMI